MKFKIAKANVSDIPYIQKVVNSINEFSKKEKNQFCEDVEAYFEYPDECIYYVCVVDERIAGFIVAEKDLPKDVWNINLLCVNPMYRRNGIAGALLNKVTSRKARLFLVETESSLNYSKAISVYLKNGFVEEARIKDFWNIGSDKIILTKRKG